jgi:AcrR family transcriptional regulator
VVSDSLTSTTVTRDAPRTARGARTRATLVAAARTVFERDGYLNTRLVDITTEASCSTGSFYTYFTNKEEVFAAVLQEAQESMLHPGAVEELDPDDPVAIIDASNRAYLQAYRRNAKLMRLLEQVATIDDDVRDLRRRRAAAFTKRNARSIRDLQARGLADPDVDPVLAARALSAMVSRMAYGVYVLEESATFDELATTLTRLWVNALRIPTDPAPPPATRKPASAKARR